MCKSDFNSEEMLVDCGGIKPDPLVPPVDEDENEKTLTPADYDRWGRVGIRVIKPASE